MFQHRRRGCVMGDRKVDGKIGYVDCLDWASDKIGPVTDRSK